LGPTHPSGPSVESSLVSGSPPPVSAPARGRREAAPLAPLSPLAPDVPDVEGGSARRAPRAPPRTRPGVVHVDEAETQCVARGVARGDAREERDGHGKVALER
jgi:hypothetical protein